MLKIFHVKRLNKMSLKKVIQFINKQSKESFKLQDDTDVVYISNPHCVKLQLLSLKGNKGTKLQIVGVLSRKENFMVVDRPNYKVDNGYFLQERKVMLAVEQLFSPNGWILIDLGT